VHYGNEQHFVDEDASAGMSKWLLTGTTPKGTKAKVQGCDFYTFRDDGKVTRKDSYRLHERRELEKAKRELEAQVQQKELLLKEVNHGVKNSLQMVSNVLDLQLPDVKSAGGN
jgi:hypothetical protein